MNKKQAPMADVTWTLESKRINIGPQANDRLKHWVGPDLSKSFGRVMPGNRFYEWRFPEGDWKSYADAVGAEKSAVATSLAALQSAVNAKVTDSAIAERILTTPDESYVLYRMLPGGAAELMVTGWGFAARRKGAGGHIVTQVDRGNTQEVKVGFMEDGEMLADRRFDIAVHGLAQSNRKSTGADGFFNFDRPRRIGDIIELTDVESKRQFRFEVEGGKSEYIFDLTVPKPPEIPKVPEAPEAPEPPEMPKPKSTVKVTTHDGRMAAGYMLTMECDNEPLGALTTDAEGRAQLPDLPVGGRLRLTAPDNHDQSQEYTVMPDATEYPFVLEEPRHDYEITIVDPENRPRAGWNFELNQGGAVITRQLDNGGHCTLPWDSLRPNMPSIITITDPTTPARQRVIDFIPEAGEWEYVLQENEVKRSPWLLVGEIALAILLLGVLVWLGFVESHGANDLSNYIMSKL